MRGKGQQPTSETVGERKREKSNIPSHSSSASSTRAVRLRLDSAPDVVAGSGFESVVVVVAAGAGAGDSAAAAGWDPFSVEAVFSLLLAADFLDFFFFFCIEM